MTDPAVRSFVTSALANEMARDLAAAELLEPGPGHTVEELTRRHLEARARGVAGLRQPDQLLDEVVDQAMQHVEDLRRHVDDLRHCWRQSGELALRAALLRDGASRFFSQRVVGDVGRRAPEKAEDEGS